MSNRRSDPDDYSDGEYQQDEQHSQKINGKIERMQLKIDELSRELTNERANHELLKQQVKASSDNGVMTTLLRSEFATFIVNNALHVPNVHDSSDMNDENCVLILKTASDMIKSLKESSHENITNRPASVNGERVHTTTSTRAHTPAQSDSELMQRIKNLEFELRLALGAAEDIKALKAKLLQLVDRVRIEKENKLKAETELNTVKKKMAMLGDHMEKLMTYLKHEAAAKIRAVESLRTSERAAAKFKEETALIVKKGVAKDRLILELREGSKILEDQLRLMDEKYLELRTKLDYARESSIKKIAKAEAKAKELRIKFALASGSTSMILDNAIALPEIYSTGGNTGEKSWATQSQSDSQSDLQSNYSKKGGSKLNKMSKSMASLPRGHSSGSQYEEVHREPSMDVVLEKIRKQSGGKVEWSDDKLRDLTKSR